MDVNSPEWPRYEERFTALAVSATPWPHKQKPNLADATCYLCLYGENGLPAQEEFAMLERMENTLNNTIDTLYRLDVDRDYWQEIILLVP
jgi:hypothetical protein